MDNSQQYQALFREHYTEILRFIERRVSDRDDAADLTADVFRIAWQRFTPDTTTSRAWLFGIARNVVLAHYRAAGRRAAAHERYEASLAVAADAPAGASTSTPAGHDHPLHGWLAELPEPDQEVLRLQYWEELSTRDIADVLGTSPAAARVRLHRAKKRLKSLITETEVRDR